MNVILKLFVIFLTLTLVSCNSFREWKEERRAARYERYSQKCLKYGFKKNTDGFRLCIQNLDIKRSADLDRIIKQNQQNSNNYINNLLYPKK